MKTKKICMYSWKSCMIWLSVKPNLLSTSSLYLLIIKFAVWNFFTWDLPFFIYLHTNDSVLFLSVCEVLCVCFKNAYILVILYNFASFVFIFGKKLIRANCVVLLFVYSWQIKIIVLLYTGNIEQTCIYVDLFEWQTYGYQSQLNVKIDWMIGV